MDILAGTEIRYDYEAPDLWWRVKNVSFFPRIFRYVKWSHDYSVLVNLYYYVHSADLFWM